MGDLQARNKILVADDDAEIREILSILLMGDGYEVITAADGKEAVEKADDTVSLIILDVNMPEKSGFLACSEIRKKTFAPILFLTARTQESDKTMGFSAGGDDYISKPFSNAELLLRVKALIRRCSQYGGYAKNSERDKLYIHDLELNTDTKTVRKNGEVILLTSTEYEILELLAKNAKKIFSMENIYNSIWKDSYMGTSDNAIMVHIKNLRRKIEVNPRNPEYLKTAWGKGYYVD
ncbi:MAG: response regulator transcription factor [Lachnospiraceae bacterium]|nr:response regulator transcription factor [Lachnospiraceae bacterium]